MHAHDLMALGERPAHQPAERLQRGVRDPVPHEGTVPPPRHEPLLEEQGQVLAGVGLRRAGRRAQLLDRPLPGEEALEQRQPGGIAECPEAPREDLERLARKRRLGGLSGHGQLLGLPGAAQVAEDPDLHAALFGPRERRFSMTISFGPFEGPDYDRAVAMARQSAEYRVVGSGEHLRHRARFLQGDVLKMRDLFEVVGSHWTCEVLVDDKPVPFGRELWLPLVWFQLLP